MDEIKALAERLAHPSPDGAGYTIRCELDNQPWGEILLEPLERIARVTAELPQDILGFGSIASVAGTAHMEVARAQEGLHDRLVEVATHLENMRASLLELQSNYLARQMARWSIGPNTRGLRVNLTGETPVDGWLNVGSHASGIVTNLLWPLPLPDACASRVFFAMAIEHFPVQRVLAILREIHRTLELGGVVRVVTQDTERYIDAYSRRDMSFFEGQRTYWPMPADIGPPLHHILAWSGASRRPEDFFDHKYGYDFETLSALLYRAGFARVERSAYMGSRHLDLRVDTLSADAGARIGDVTYALFIEAVK